MSAWVCETCEPKPRAGLSACGECCGWKAAPISSRELMREAAQRIRKDADAVDLSAKSTRFIRAVADWLDDAAEVWPGNEPGADMSAFACIRTARAYLGQP